MTKKKWKRKENPKQTKNQKGTSYYFFLPNGVKFSVTLSAIVPPVGYDLREMLQNQRRVVQKNGDW